MPEMKEEPIRDLKNINLVEATPEVLARIKRMTDDDLLRSSQSLDMIAPVESMRRLREALHKEERAIKWLTGVLVVLTFILVWLGFEALYPTARKPTTAATPQVPTATAAPANADIDAGRAAFNRGDYKTAFREWKPLADKGVAEAQLSLARLYFYGIGVPQDYKEAVRWYRLAADQGNVWAQIDLGSLYEEGEAVKRDYVRAHMWYNLASAQGGDQTIHESVIEAVIARRDALAKKMALAQIVEAQKLAREWKPKK